MQKLLVIPDIHGIETWKRFIYTSLQDPDVHVVYLGDYVDSYVIPGYKILSNLKDIISIKKKYPERITLLLGNHDYVYVYGKTNTSGFDAHMLIDYRQTFNDNWKLFDLAWGYQGKDKYTLLTHAGLTKYFYDKIEKEIYTPLSTMNLIFIKGDIRWRELPLHELLNYFKDQIHLLWTIGYRRNGSDLFGSIVWADKRELLDNPYPGINQIVGHTPIECSEIHSVNGDQLIFTDVHSDYYVWGYYIELE